jgi:hypothetical protein
MRITSKDAVGTVLAAIAVVVTLAVSYGWGWPLLADYRAGTVALAVIGIAMCVAGSEATSARPNDPLVVGSTILGVAALGLIAAGLIWATAQLFVALAAVIVALWLIATVRHLITASDDRRAPAAAS